MKGFLKMHVLCHFSRVRLFATLWTVAFQSPLSIGFSSQEYQSRLPCPLPVNLPDPGIKVVSPSFQAYSLSFKVKNENQSCSVVSNSLQSMDYTVQGILQARTLEWVAFPFSTWLSPPRDWIAQGNRLELLDNSRLWKGSGELKS